MPTERRAGRHARRAGRRAPRRRRCCASAACRTRAPTGGGARADHVDRAASTPPRPGAAPPQTVGGLDLVPGMIPGAAVRGTASPPRSARPPLDGSRPGARVGARRELPDRRRVAAHLRRRRLAAAVDVVVVGLQLPPRRARLARRRRACRRTSACATSRAAVDVAARQRRAAFGGDPDRIVLMGESAGAGLHRAPARDGRRVRCRGRDPPERRARGHARRRRRGVGGRAVPRRRRRDVASTTLRDAAGRRAPRGAGADGRSPRSARSA